MTDEKEQDSGSEEPDTDYEFIEIKVSRKIDIHLSLDDLISALQQQANDLAESKEQLDAKVAASVADRLNQLNQLAHQLKSEVAQLKPGGGN